MIVVDQMETAGIVKRYVRAYMRNHYSILHFALRGGTDEHMIVYLSTSNDGIFVRPHDEFIDQVCVDVFGMLRERMCTIK